MSRGYAHKPAHTGPDNSQKAAQVTYVQHFEGPLPTPDDLLKYENVQEGLADRIMKLTEKSLDSTIEVRKEMVNVERKTRLRGQWFGFIITIFFISVALLAEYLKISSFLTKLFGFGVFVPIIISVIQFRGKKQK